jgi:uracil-DNA glycosylase family 4
MPAAPPAGKMFDPNCTACPRLARHLAAVRARHPDYHARPVRPFGDRKARLLIVGLAPGLHGANRTGRPFTGDYAGILLYRTLYEHGFSNRPQSVSASDRLRLRGCRITNAVKCLPPANKPTPEEVATCNGYLAAELQALSPGSVVLALGTIAHRATLRALGLKMTAVRFRHGVRHSLPGQLHLLDSYHCSRYNTQTRRLTPAMFSAVVRKARRLLAK